jgi:hypothetical protein
VYVRIRYLPVTVRRLRDRPGFAPCKGCSLLFEDKDMAVIDRGGKRGIIKRCMPCTWAYLKTMGEGPKVTPTDPTEPSTLF